MANELQGQTAGRTGLTAYFIMLDAVTGNIWNGTTWASYSTANYKTGAVAATGRADGSYLATMPAGVNAAKWITYKLLNCAGGAPVTTNAAETDELLSGPNDPPLYWSSTAWVFQTGDSYARLGAPAGASVSADIAALQADLPQRITKNTALSAFTFVMKSSTDHITPTASLTVTATRSLDGAAFASCANSVSEVSNGVYKIDLAAADLNANIVTLRFTATGADPTIVTIPTQPT